MTESFGALCRIEGLEVLARFRTSGRDCIKGQTPGRDCIKGQTFFSRIVRAEDAGLPGPPRIKNMMENQMDNTIKNDMETVVIE